VLTESIGYVGDIRTVIIQLVVKQLQWHGKYRFKKKLPENTKKDTYKVFYAYVKDNAKTAKNIGP